MTSKPSAPKNYRDAGSGQFVTPQYAKSHPKTTVGERRAPAPSPAPKKR